MDENSTCVPLGNTVFSSPSHWIRFRARPIQSLGRNANFEGGRPMQVPEKRQHVHFMQRIFGYIARAFRYSTRIDDYVVRVFAHPARHSLNRAVLNVEWLSERITP